MSLNQLPKVLLKYLSSFFDIKSFACFSLTNKKHQLLFSHIPKIFGLIRRGFPNTEKYQQIQFYTNEKIENNYTLLQICLLENKIENEMIKYLIDNKSDLNSKTKDKIFVGFYSYIDYENTPLHLACKNPSVSFETVKYMIDCRYNLGATNYKNRNPLHLACKKINISPQIIKYLVEKKSILQSYDHKNEQFPSYMLSKKIKKTFGNTPLHYAI